MCTLFVVKVYYNFVVLTLFVELSRFITITEPLYKDTSIFSSALCFVVKVYYNFTPLDLFVEYSRFKSL